MPPYPQNPYANYNPRSNQDLLLMYYLMQAQRQQQAQQENPLAAFGKGLAKGGGGKTAGAKIAELLGLGGNEMEIGSYDPEQVSALLDKGIPELGIKGTSSAASGVPSGAIGQNVDGSYIFADGTSSAANPGLLTQATTGSTLASVAGGVPGAIRAFNADNSRERVRGGIQAGAGAVGGFFGGPVGAFVGSRLGSVGGKHISRLGSDTNSTVNSTLQLINLGINPFAQLSAITGIKELDPVGKGINRVFGGKRTENRELKNLQRLKSQGLVDDAFIQAFAPNAKKIGKRGRGGIDPNQDYQDALARGKTEEQAQQAKRYAELVKSGKDEEAQGLLSGEDIWGYANVAEAIAKATGKNYSTGLNESQRRSAAQAILDYDKENKKALYSSKGSYNVNLDDILKNRINNAITSSVSMESLQNKPSISRLPQSGVPSSSPSINKPAGGVAGFKPGSKPSNIVNYPRKPLIDPDPGMQYKPGSNAEIDAFINKITAPKKEEKKPSKGSWLGFKF